MLDEATLDREPEILVIIKATAPWTPGTDDNGDPQAQFTHKFGLAVHTPVHSALRRYVPGFQPEDVFPEYVPWRPVHDRYDLCVVVQPITNALIAPSRHDAARSLHPSLIHCATLLAKKAGCEQPPRCFIRLELRDGASRIKARIHTS